MPLRCVGSGSISVLLIYAVFCRNGSKRLHGVDLWKGVQYLNGSIFESLDTSVVCVGEIPILCFE